MSCSLGIFHPENNFGLEVFFIGTVSMAVFVVCFFFWAVYTDRKWRKSHAYNS